MINQVFYKLALCLLAAAATGCATPVADPQLISESVGELRRVNFTSVAIVMDVSLEVEYQEERGGLANVAGVYMDIGRELVYLLKTHGIDASFQLQTKASDRTRRTATRHVYLISLTHLMGIQNSVEVRARSRGWEAAVYPMSPIWIGLPEALYVRRYSADGKACFESASAKLVACRLAYLNELALPLLRLKAAPPIPMRMREPS